MLAHLFGTRQRTDTHVISGSYWVFSFSFSKAWAWCRGNSMAKGTRLSCQSPAALRLEVVGADMHSSVSFLGPVTIDP